MRRTVPLLVLIGGAAMLAPVLAVFAQSSSTPSSKPHHRASLAGSASTETSREAIACTPCKSASASSDDGRIVEELTAILKETRSTETFAVTAMVLGRMGPAAKQALPVIIRNAERLELFENLYKTSASADNTALQEVVEAIEMILDKKGGTKRRIRHPYTAPPPPSNWTPPPTPVTPAPLINGPAAPVPCPPATPVAPPPVSSTSANFPQPPFAPPPVQQPPAKPVEGPVSNPVPAPPPRAG
jgi:hypothetical protein